MLTVSEGFYSSRLLQLCSWSIFAFILIYLKHFTTNGFIRCRMVGITWLLTSSAHKLMWASPFQWFKLLFTRELLLWCCESQNYWFIYGWYSSERSKPSRYKLQITPAQQLDKVHMWYSTEQQTGLFFDCIMLKTEWSVQIKAKCSKMRGMKYVKKVLIMSTCPDKAVAKTANKSCKNTRRTGKAQCRQNNIVIWTLWG